MTAAAAIALPRPTDPPVSPPPPALARTPDPLVEIARLRRELRAAQTQNRTFIRLLNDADLTIRPTTGLTVTPVGTALYGAQVTPILVMAQHAEASGAVPAVQFQRNAQGQITGLALYVVTAIAGDASAGAPAHGMEVIA